jgi:hypothetical protein
LPDVRVQRCYAFNLFACRQSVQVGLAVPEGIAFAETAPGCLDAAKAAPALAPTGGEAAHLVFGVMNSAAVAEKRVGHRPLLRLIDLPECEDVLAGLQDDESCSGRLIRYETLPISTPTTPAAIKAGACEKNARRYRANGGETLMFSYAGGLSAFSGVLAFPVTIRYRHVSAAM